MHRSHAPSRGVSVGAACPDADSHRREFPLAPLSPARRSLNSCAELAPRTPCGIRSALGFKITSCKLALVPTRPVLLPAPSSRAVRAGPGGTPAGVLAGGPPQWGVEIFC